MEPVNIEIKEKKIRSDLPEGDKRVELHLHTRFSALDALTDIDAVVQTAARWGHRAVAITDHGAAQAYPAACAAGKKYGIKIIYGIEAYYVNDVDDRLAVSAPSDAGLDTDFVAFDLETTGLRPGTDAITEIGAVRFSGGLPCERFQTFVNPGRKIPPEITRLTGITDEDVKAAPTQSEAVRDFLRFAAGAPLVAHNADFDTAFISAVCGQSGLPFDNVSVDTLTMSRALLSELKKHSLDSVAAFLGLPEFNHHRASDDAETTGRTALVLFDRLREAGVTSLNIIDAELSKLRSGVQRRGQPRHLTILVYSQAGMRNLYKLISLSYLKHFRKNPVMPKSLILENREGLLLGSACENGEIFHALVSGRSERELRRLAEFYDFLEIQPLCNNRFLIDDGRASCEEDLREFNRRIVRLGNDLNKPVCATGDVHFLEPEHEIFRRILLSNKYPDADKPLPLYFKTTQEMLEEFSYLGEDTARRVVIESTNGIADMCGEVAPLPKGLFKPKIENSAEELQFLVREKMREMYGDRPPEQVLRRVDAELKDIIGCAYDVIYMSAQKLVSKSTAAGYLVGSRGSVGSSVVAYFAGITEVNGLNAHYRCPVCKHADFEAGVGYGCGVDMPDADCPVCGSRYVKDGFSIPFETFLGFGGDKVPDIDLNFSGEYQAQAHKDTIELFGAEHVFRAGTIGTIAEKTAYGYVKKYLEERGKTASKVEESRLAAGLTGVKRTTGQHPGGLVVIPQDKEIYDFCPVQHPADDTDSDIITTHFEYHSMESNLLKLDILGHDDPTMIKMLEDLTGIGPLSIPLDDPETMSLFNSPAALGLPEDDPIIGKTGTIAVPEFGTNFTRQLLVDTKPKSFSTLIKLSGFSHGTDVWAGNIKDLVLSGIATVEECAGCREDIMLYLISKGMEEKRAFKFTEAVRKGKLPKGDPNAWPEGIEDEMRGLGVPQWYIDSCKKIQYLFPKAHAAAYVIMAMRIAWFKVHRPIEFYSAYFSVRAKVFDLDTMTCGADKIKARITELSSRQDLKQNEKDEIVVLEVCYEFYMRGFSFAGIDIYRSDPVRFLIDSDKLLPPFIAVSGLGEAAARDIAAHTDREFTSIDEFAQACPKVSRANIEQLKKAGAFGNLPESAQMSLF